ncbi:DUF6231 family protein [Kaarinaea lacus]
MTLFPNKLITKILNQCTPKTLIGIGKSTKNILQDYIRSHPDCKADYYKPNEALPELQKDVSYDFALVANTLEHLDTNEANHLLANLRDIHSKKLVVIVPIGTDWREHKSYWQETDLLALGFLLKGSYKVNNLPVHIYAFDIENYKTTPDWLNNRYWANPENYDKYWW